MLPVTVIMRSGVELSVIEIVASDYKQNIVCTKKLSNFFNNKN